MSDEGEPRAPAAGCFHRRAVELYEEGVRHSISRSVEGGLALDRTVGGTRLNLIWNLEDRRRAKSDSMVFTVSSGVEASSDLVYRPFTTDVCSMWPDGTWATCCIEHDIAYWCGGPAEARERADDAFRACMRAEGGPCLSTLSYVGVRVGGPAWMPFPWRWGYGWDWLEDPR